MAPKHKRGVEVDAAPIPPDPPLVPVPEDAALPGDTLCLPCKKLKLTARRFIVFPTDAEYGQWSKPHKEIGVLQSVAATRKNTNCPLCRLILVALAGGAGEVPEADRRGRATRVSVSWGTMGRTPNRDEPWATLSDVRMLYPSLVVGGSRFPDLDIASMAVFPDLALLANDAPPDMPTAARQFLPRPIRRNAIDFDLVNRWFQICGAQHNAVCNSTHTMGEMGWTAPAQSVPAFRCIDLQEECLVLLRDVKDGDTEPDVRYAALSYVWGRGPDDAFFKTLGANVAQRSESGFFSRPENRACIPRTISDAMTVARRIGLRYLWVDSLCIVQDGSGDEWLDAIRKMDVVYGAAYVTIVASGSSDAFAGIEGIEDVEGGRGPGAGVRNIEQIDDGFRLAFASSVPVGRYVYPTRGWTYQEEHFSCRALVFANGAVSLRCRSGISFEENRFEDTSVVDKLASPSFAGTDNDIGDFEGLIQNYSVRQLTNEADIYRAFAGIGRQMKRRLKCDLCHGLPAAFFDWFLLWQPLRDERDGPALIRRPEAPSWSWAGWRGAVWSRIWDWYTRDMQVVQRGIRKRTWIVWYQRVGQGSTQCVLVGGPGKNKDRDDANHRNIYGGRHRKHKRFHDIDCSVTDPTPRDLEAVPTYTKDLISEHPGSGFLQFWTISAVFELRFVGAGDDGAFGSQARLSLAESDSSESDTSNADGDWEDVAGSDNEDGDSDDLPPPDGLAGGEDSDGDGELEEFDQDKQPGVKLIIGGKSGRALGRIYVPSSWKGLPRLDTADAIVRRYELILLCEARDERAEDFSRVDEDGGWRYRVMLVDSKAEGRYFERVAIGSIGLGDLGEAYTAPEWKEWVLG